MAASGAKPHRRIGVGDRETQIWLSYLPVEDGAGGQSAAVCPVPSIEW